IRTLRRADGPELRVVLDSLALPALAPKACRVDEDEGAFSALEDDVDGVARRPWNVRNDDALLAEDRVQKARLADVGTTEDRDPNRILLDVEGTLSREQLHDAIEQVAGPVPVARRDRD